MRISTFLLLLCLWSQVRAQTLAKRVWTITADSTKITGCDSDELIIENHTQGVPGFLYNTGNGRTIFKHGAIRLNDSMYLVGADTVNLGSAWMQGGNSFGATGVLGTMDNNHLDFFTNGVRHARLDSAGGGFSLISWDGMYKWLDFQGGPTESVIWLTPSNPSIAPYPSMRICAGYSDTIIAYQYADLTIDGADGLDLIGGWGGGSVKGIRFFPNYGPSAALFTRAGNFCVGDSTTDDGSRFQVNGTSTFSDNVAIGTTSATAQLHTTGSVRFAGLTQDSTQNQVIVSDVSGNLYYRSASSLAADNLVRSSLAVNGPIKAKRVILSPDGWADYVFDNTYKLPPLDALGAYLRKAHHLPGIPSAAEIKKNGLDVGANQAALLKKVEELTLYTIDQDKRLTNQRSEIEALKAEVEALKKMVLENTHK